MNPQLRVVCDGVPRCLGGGDGEFSTPARSEAREENDELVGGKKTPASTPPKRQNLPPTPPSPNIGEY